MERLKVGIIGLGQRGHSMAWAEFTRMTDKFDVVAVCDLYEDRVERTQKMFQEKCGFTPAGTTDYKELLDMDVEAVYIACSWEDHVKVACAAMERGVYVGLEVGGAYSIKDCWRMVDTYEKTRVPVFLLENCCYGKIELMTKVMAERGFFGDVVHCEGSYSHDLRSEIAEGEEIRHYRLRNYIARNCDNYPTHALVPIGKILKINRGNRIVSLTSTASCAKGLHQYVVNRWGEEHKLANVQFNQGDVITTVIKCANGETITLRLDTTLPRAYSRNFTVHGTKAAYFEDTNMVFEDGKHNHAEWDAKQLWDNAGEYEEEYLHPLWVNYDASGGHGGMDYLTLSAFAEYAKAKKEPPIDVYDAAVYMAVTALSEESIAKGSAPVMMPDFTTGLWYQREQNDDSKYAL